MRLTTRRGYRSGGGRHELLPGNEKAETETLLGRVAGGDRAAVNELVNTHRAYLKQVIDMRMDRALRGRVDPSDIVQETQLVVSKRIFDFLERRPTTFKLWLRGEAMQQVAMQYRRHVKADRRSVQRECQVTDASSVLIARKLLSGTPSKIVARKEMAERVRGLIEELPENDREILLLRYIEELTNAEAAELLNIDPGTARKRHGRALKKLLVLLAKAGIHDVQD